MDNWLEIIIEWKILKVLENYVTDLPWKILILFCSLWALLYCDKLLHSCLTLCNPMDWAWQVPLSMGFSRQECWSGLPFPPPILLLLLLLLLWVLFSINCQRSTTIIWQLLFYRAARKRITGLKLWNLAKGSTKDADNDFICITKQLDTPYWPEAWMTYPVNSPSWQQAILYHTWRLTQYYFGVKWSEVPQSCPTLCDPM